MPNPWDALEQVEGLKELNWRLEEKLWKAEARESCYLSFQQAVLRLTGIEIPGVAVSRVESMKKRLEKAEAELAEMKAEQDRLRVENKQLRQDYLNVSTARDRLRKENTELRNEICTMQTYY